MGYLLWPEGRITTATELFPPRTVEDLQLSQMTDAMAFNHFWRLSTQELCRLWTTDPATILYRQDVLRDVIANPELEGLWEQLLNGIDTWETRSSRATRGVEDRNKALDLWDLSFLDSFLQCLTKLDTALAPMTLRSEGMQLFREKIHRQCTTGRFPAVSNAFTENCSGYSFPTRITLGFNLNESLKPVSLKVLAVPEQKQKSKGRRMSMTPSAMMTARQVLSKALGDLGMSISAFVRQESAELRTIKQDIIFYLSALHLKKSWEQSGLACCIPVLSPGKVFSTEEMFNPLLLVHGTERIVANDITLEENGEILVLTGANQGGKTVFLMSMALTQWLFQLGIMVPCKQAVLSPAAQILTVFAPSGTGTSVTNDRGLLSEEAGRISDAVKRVTANSMVLLNEPLNATSPMENLYISREILGVLKAAGCRGIWVTHLYELASDRERVNTLLPWGSTLGSIRIVVTHDDTGTHSTYHIVRGEPEFNSYAAEVMHRQGLNYHAAQGPAE